MAARGGGSFTVPTLYPPLGADWTRVGAVLSASAAWEQTAIQEPDVTWDGSQFVMFAKGGWADPALGRYTSTDGLTWARYAGNPVLGRGGSGYAPEISQAMIHDPSGDLTGTITCYFNESGDVDPNTPRYATSTDGGFTWAVGGSGSYVTNPGSITQWGNRHAWQEGSNWFMLQEARISGVWKILYLTSSDGLSWTVANGGAALTTLQPGGAGSYGGPTMLRSPTIAGSYHAWYHAVGAAGDNPTDIYHATSTDRITWTIDPATPVLTHTGSGDEADQIADPSVLVVGSTAYLFYAAVINATSTGVIKLATAPATQ